MACSAASARSSARSICRRWRVANSSAPTRYRSPTQVRISPTYRCKATRDGDGWVITGTKNWCTFADGADFISVLARTKQPLGSGAPSCRHQPVPGPEGARQIPAGLTGSPIRKIGYFGWKTWELSFDNLPPAGRRDVGTRARRRRRGQGFSGDRRDSKRHARTPRPARSASRAARWKIRSPMRKRRVQFGQPIGEFQAIRFKIADMATEIEAARQLMYFVCR